MNIRIASTDDIRDLIEFNQAMALETEGRSLEPDLLERGVSAVLEDPQKGFYVVAEDAETIVGALMITFEWSDWRNAWFWWVQSVFVRPASRGKGVYGDLYDYVKDKAQAAGNICGFRLYVDNDNSNAAAVYEKNGMSASHYVMYEEEI